MNDHDVEPAHPRFRQRRAEVEDQSLRTRNRRLVVLGGLILLGLIAAASTQSALLDIDEVEVVGSVRTDPAQVRALAAVEIGAPLLGLDTSAIESRVTVLPEIDSAVVTKSWNGVVTVELNERLPVAWIASPEGIIIVAADGTVLDVVVPPEPEVALPPGEFVLPAELVGLPELSGAMFSTDPGAQVPDVLADAVVVAAALPRDIATVTEQVEITVDTLVLRLVGGGAVALGDARDLDDKFDAVRAFLAQVDLGCLESLNVRAPTVPVIVRRPDCF